MPARRTDPKALLDALTRLREALDEADRRLARPLEEDGFPLLSVHPVREPDP